MGGAIKNVATGITQGVKHPGMVVGMGGGGTNLLGRIAGDVMTGGLAEFGRKDPWTGLVTSKSSGLMSLFGGGGSGSSTDIGGKISPMQALQETGGAPLLAAIAMGANPNQAIMSFFGASGDYNSWLSTLDPASQNAVKGLSTQMNSIQQNTQLKTQAVQKLVNDFPDFMASAIPKYAGIADKMTMGAAQQALQNVAAKYAADGQLSSGATAAAMARTAAEGERQNLQFGTDLAGQDWMNRFNQSNALLNFQQKMLGQGAEQGQSALQKMWDVNAGLATTQYKGDLLQAQQKREASGALFGTLGEVGGTLAGAAIGGPMGALVGGTLGGAVGSYAGGK